MKFNKRYILSWHYHQSQLREEKPCYSTPNRLIEDTQAKGECLYSFSYLWGAPTLFEDSSNEDQFELVVGLQSEIIVKDEDVYASIKINEMNSPATTKGSIFIGTMVVAFVNTIW